MCAIIDAGCANEVFGNGRNPAGRAFFDWIAKGRGQWVLGGKNRRELLKTSAQAWLKELTIAGRVYICDEEAVDERAIELRPACASNDEHVIALAQISGARLVYANDGLLQKDVRDASLVSQPRGKVYSTRLSTNFNRSHQGLLRRNDLCASSR